MLTLRTLALSLLCLSARPLAAAAEPAPRPNVVVILADDLGIGDLGVHNPITHTPRLDALAGESATADSFRVHNKCAPTRASLLTGRHFLRAGVWGVHGGRDNLDPGERTIGEAFRDAGYATAMMGKWHSGQGDRYSPWDRGFDVARTANIYKHHGDDGAAEVVNGVARPIAGWSDRHHADAAVAWMSEDREQPFFLYLALLAPHSPWKSPPEFLERFREAGHPNGLARLLAMVSYMDDCVGRLLDGLEAADLADDTVVVFLSDNGPVNNGGPNPDGRGRLQTSGKDWNRRNALKLRGGKGQVYEGGVRSALFVRWPGHIAPGPRAGDVAVEDLFPTLLSLAGGDPAPAPAPGDRPLDGRDVGPLLLDPEGAAAAELRAELAERVGVFPEAEPADSFDGWHPTRIQKFEAISAADAPDRFAYDRMRLAAVRGTDKLVQDPEAPRESHDLAAHPGERAPGPPADTADLDTRARAWWADLLAEPTAFRRPLSFVAPTPGAPTVLQARNAGALRGVQLTAHDVTGWDAAGDRLTMPVRVDAPGRYLVHLLGEADAGTGAVFEVRFGDAAPLAATADRPLRLEKEHPLFGWAPDAALDAGVVDLPEGRLDLVVKLTEPPAGGGPAIDHLNHVVLTPAD